MNEHKKKSGYFTVHIEGAGIDGAHARLPYIVYAESDYHAARKVKHETGYMARAQDIEGPYARIEF